jgi:hypothetical protein
MRGYSGEVPIIEAIVNINEVIHIPIPLLFIFACRTGGNAFN